MESGGQTGATRPRLGDTRYIRRNFQNSFGLRALTGSIWHLPLGFCRQLFPAVIEILPRVTALDKIISLSLFFIR